MLSDVLKKRESCIDCVSVQGQSFKGRPPLVSILVGGLFECMGIDFVELDKSTSGNHCSSRTTLQIGQRFMQWQTTRQRLWQDATW